MAKTKKEEDDRDIEILEWRIANTDRLMAVFAEKGMSQEKIDKLQAKKVKHEGELEKIKPKKTKP